MRFLKNASFFLFVAVLFLTTHFLGAQAPKKEDVVWIDRFEQKNFKTLKGGDWFTFSDSVSGGASSIQKMYYKDKTVKSQILQYSYKLQQGAWRWDPYAALACNVSMKEIPAGIQAVAYEHKGAQHSFLFRTGNVGDYAYYQKLIPASKDWTTVVIPLAELRQPDWGKKVKFKPETLQTLAWQVSGQSGDSGNLAMDNIRFLYTPQAPTATAPSNSITIGSTQIIYSKILDEDRTLWIFLPQSLEKMKASKVHYPVVYLLDGDSHFKGLSGILSQLGSNTFESPFPEMILVGIANTNRMRDLSPSPVKKSPFHSDTTGQGNTGGGNKFMNFIEQELVPHIDSVYPTSSYRMFIGHSLGGLLVLHTFMHRPHLFTSYLAIDPSIWWDNQLLIREADSLLSKKRPEGKKIFISLANTLHEGVDTATIRSDTSLNALHMRSILTYRNILKKYPKGVKTKMIYYPDDTHSSVPLISEYDGIRYFFDFYRITFLDRLALAHFNVDSAFTAHYKKISGEMGYTVLPPENQVNGYGYYFLKQKKYDKAYAFFNLNRTNYPASNNVFDSLGEYYEATGEKQKAMEAYSNALQIQEIPYTRRKYEKLKAEK